MTYISWVRQIEINVGKDLQFIRFNNGAIVGGLAGLTLYTAEILSTLA